IAALADIADADVVVVTFVGRGHLAGLGVLAGVLREKSAIITHARPEAVVVLNADDAHFKQLREIAAGRRVVSFGLTHRATVQASSLRMTTKDAALAVSFDVDIEGKHYGGASLRRPGMHDVRNFLAVLGIAVATFGPTPEWIAGCVDAAKRIEVTPRRLESKLCANGVRVLDDTYNANPESLLAALAVLDRIRDAKRRVLVLGDMLELGTEAETLHDELGAAAAGRVDLLVAVGPLAARAGRAFREESAKLVLDFADVDALLPELPLLFGPGDFVLFKGSRGVALDRAVDALCGAPS
ncbi:MAG TPA: UDP-N-acetylmuramoyl-tripeptide--D-alanyl-D-alanine ligase, partial [Planctomycetota bacterium]|nr:UDP-N-acetylmuramoyl-tripeptide--D-alanyl-D-alanine ligase [Planctomycetota bacterium]